MIEDEDYYPSDGDEPFYDEYQNYADFEQSGSPHSELWRSFCESIVHEQRFFNSDAHGLIAEIFDGIHLQQDHEKQPPVYLIEPGDENSEIFRARIANNASERKEIADDPKEKLGAPPPRKRRAGRMNSAGISALYGAFDEKTCISELRPVVGSSVIGARFTVVRPIYVLDTTRFHREIREMSLFARDQIVRNQQWLFMQQFMHEIAKPIFPDDEHLDYIPTQAVAEYLLRHHEFKRNGKTARIEAITDSSAQNPSGKNIVLLGDAGRVAQVSEKKPAEAKSGSMTDFFPDVMATFLSDFEAPSNPGLQYVEGSKWTKRVRAAAYESAMFTDENFGPEEVDF